MFSNLSKGSLNQTINFRSLVRSEGSWSVVLPVRLSDSAYRRQLAHQQFEDGCFTGAVFTDLPVK